jgi:membrane dipeptidase
VRVVGCVSCLCVFGACVVVGCVHGAVSTVAVPAAGALVDDGSAPFAKAVADDEDRAADVDGDGVVTRGDRWARGSPQLFGDAHAHPFMGVPLRPFFRGDLDGGVVATSSSDVMTTQITLAGLQRGATNLLFAKAYVPVLWQACAKGGRAVDELLCQLEAARQFARRHADDMAIAVSADDVREAVAAHKVAVVFAVEGGDVESLHDLERLQRAGVRVMTITHFNTNAIGGAAASTLAHFDNPNVVDSFSAVVDDEDGIAKTPGGLTPFGVAVVKRMEELGMVIDLTHASDATVRDVLRETTGPLLFSHSGSRALHPTEHNISDDVARAVAARGGVVAVIPYVVELMADGMQECRAFYAHFKHLLDVVGPDHIAIGGDFNGMISRPGPCDGGGNGVDATGQLTVADMPEQLQQLQDLGVPGKVLEGMGANLLRLLEVTEQRATTKPPKKPLPWDHTRGRR